jgi:hypothetical protein
VEILPALDGELLQLRGARLEPALTAPVHHDLELVVRLHRRLQAQNELAALQWIARNDTEIPVCAGRVIHVVAVRSLRPDWNFDSFVARDHADPQIDRRRPDGR